MLSKHLIGGLSNVFKISTRYGVNASIKGSSIRCLSTEVKSKIEDAIKAKDVCLFMKGTPSFPQCGFSRAAVAILNMQGVEQFNHVNILEDEEIRSGIKEFSSWPTIPQLYVQGEFIGGCDILMQMHQNGELEKLLLEKKIVAPEEEVDNAPTRN